MRDLAWGHCYQLIDFAPTGVLPVGLWALGAVPVGCVDARWSRTPFGGMLDGAGHPAPSMYLYV